MTPEYWQRLEVLFDATVQMHGAARGTYLDEACAGDEELRRHVEAMLSSVDEPEDMLGGVIAREAAAMTSAVAGERIGQYEIVRELGHGGMGTVFLAVRADDQFRKQVAIKLMRSDLLGQSTVERFRVERQILANLEHPGIARLLDGGTTAAGAPYVVMEYVDGLAIDTYCTQKQLGLRERIGLFRRVADAVSYAHRNLVVHRDIKPENVLVTAAGDPKLLDFGIAKLLKTEEGAGDSGGLTLAVERLMTPEYASPEQARGDAITTLSDVYSLGVLLYKMLTDRVPVRVSSTRSSEIEREICETAPKVPSAAGRESGAWAKLSREEAHDLDTILLVALHKEPARRYASVENLSADLGRFLDGFPVLARGDSWGYRAGKLIRRRPWAMATATLVLVLIVVFAISMTVLAKRARNEARTANEVTDFLISVFQANDPSSGRGDKVTARELLDRGALQLDTKLKEDPAVQARLFDTMGALYNDLGSSQKAEELLKRSLDVRRTRLSLNDEAAADTLDNLGDVALDLSRFAEAEQFYRQALAIHRARSGKQSALVAQDEARLASALWDMGRFPEAEALDREAIAAQTKATGEDDLVTLDMQNDLGTVFQSEGRYEEAAERAKYTLDHRLRVEPKNHPDLGYSWHNYSQPLASLGRYADAEYAERQALAVRIAAYGESHPQVALSEEELGGLLVQTGQYEEARGLIEKALAIDLKAYGPESRDVSFARGNYAKVLLAMGQGTRAREEAATTVRVREKVFSPRHPKTADAIEDLAETDLALGNLAEADRELRTAIEIRREAFGPRHVLVASADRLLAEVLAEGGKLDGAEKYARESLEIVRKGYPSGHPLLAQAEATLAWVELDMGHTEGTVGLLRDSYERAKVAHGAGHARTAAIGMRLARAMAMSGDVPGGLQMAQAQVGVLVESKSPEWRVERGLAMRVKAGGGGAALVR